MSDSSMPSGQERSPTATTEDRRGFFGSFASFAAAGIGAVLGIGPVAVGVYAMIMDPLRKKTAPGKSGRQEEYKEGYYYVADMSELDETNPRRFTIMADKINAWNFMKNQPIGAVYMRKHEGMVQCFHTTCPHAGCAVSFELDSKAYLCPCHNSSFDVDGAKLESAGATNPSPRDLDSLVVEVVDDRVYVKYENYFTGRHDKTVK